jgi:Tol biopolymer transport system component
MSARKSAAQLIGVTFCATMWVAAARAQVSPDRPAAIVLTATQRLAGPAPSLSSTVALSRDGRVLAFESESVLLPADANNAADVYVLDLDTGVLTLASEAWDGGKTDGASGQPGLSGDGRFVVFTSYATNLLPGAGGTRGDIYLRDRVRRDTRRISTAAGGGAADTWSANPNISADGRVVAFESGATNLTDGEDLNHKATDIYAFDTGTGRIERVSVGSDGRQGAAGSFGAAISGDGRMIAFTSRADLGCPRLPGQAGGSPLANVYVRDLGAHVTHCASTAPNGGAADGASFHAAIDATGRRVAFASDATNLGSRDRNHTTDVYLRDLEARTITLVSRTPHGEAANGRSWRPAISGDGSTVAFTTNASNFGQGEGCPFLVPDANLLDDVYAFDVPTGLTTRLSTGECDDVWWESSHGPAIDADGRLVAFSSRHPTSDIDIGHDDDAFVVRRGRRAGTADRDVPEARSGIDGTVPVIYRDPALPGAPVRARTLTPERFTDTVIFFGGEGPSGRR